MAIETGAGRRRRYTAEFKAQVVATCRRPGVSVAAIALAHRLNANLLRNWMRGRGHGQPGRPAATTKESAVSPRPATLVPISVNAPSNDIHIVVQYGSTTLRITWPVSQADICGRWLRDFLG